MTSRTYILAWELSATGNAIKEKDIRIALLAIKVSTDNWYNPKFIRIGTNETERQP